MEAFRNILAQNILATTKEAYEEMKTGIITFLNFENILIAHTYSNVEIEEYRAMVKSVQNKLFEALK